MIGNTYSRKLCVYFVIAAFLSSLICKGKAFTSHQGQQSRHTRGNVRSYDRRSAGSLPSTVTLQTLKNASFMMCSEAMSMPYARMVQLNDEHMRSFLNDMGGSYVKDYMAATQDEASENFPNMINLTRPVTVDGSTGSLTTLDNLVAKQTIVDDVNKMTAFLKVMNSTTLQNETELTNSGTPGSEHIPKKTLSTETPTSSEITNKSMDNTSVVTRISDTTYVTPSLYNVTNNTVTALPNISTVNKVTNMNKATQDKVTQTSTVTPHTVTSTQQTVKTGTSQLKATTTYNKTVTSTLLSSPTHEVHSTTSVPNSNFKTEPVTLTQTTYTVTPATTLSTKNAVTAAARMSTTLDPDILSGLEQLKHYVEGSGSKRDLDFIWRSANTTLHPSTLLGLAAGSARTKRNADGSYTREEYCQKKGTLTTDRRYVHMCTLCAATTKLTDDMFPRFINEAVCKTGDTDCFTIGGTSHGQCKQTKFSLNMLRKKTGHCNMLLHEGETLVFENWELVPQMIRVACECTINKLSMFSQYVGHDVPLG